MTLAKVVIAGCLALTFTSCVPKEDRGSQFRRNGDQSVIEAEQTVDLVKNRHEQTTSAPEDNVHAGNKITLTLYNLSELISSDEMKLFTFFTHFPLVLSIECLYYHGYPLEKSGEPVETVVNVVKNKCADYVRSVRIVARIFNDAESSVYRLGDDIVDSMIDMVERASALQVTEMLMKKRAGIGVRSPTDPRQLAVALRAEIQSNRIQASSDYGAQLLEEIQGQFLDDLLRQI